MLPDDENFVDGYINWQIDNATKINNQFIQSQQEDLQKLHNESTIQNMIEKKINQMQKQLQELKNQHEQELQQLLTNHQQELDKNIKQLEVAKNDKDNAENVCNEWSLQFMQMKNQHEIKAKELLKKYEESQKQIIGLNHEQDS
eukprot:TRINITY_DN27573_c0_g1_i2.p3 TRINITY_DN27573_c0_g1~~TRINITY_DN27573_c0_g1_i2.p3  ORF type:complete len:144 (-),score=23.70 TRINITY_DN27573_c0_g1_i2:191-622(-)